MTVGIDLGGTNIAVGVVNEDQKILGRGNRKTLPQRKTKAIFDDIADAVREACSNAGFSVADMDSIGLATPGSVEKSTGKIVFAGNLDLKNVSARALLMSQLSRPVFVENDANCAALGEALAGSGRGVASFLAITLGTGVGSGIVINGNIVNGVNDAAGECGHMVIVADGKRCSCGRRGCWECYASATALIEQTKEAMNHNPQSELWRLVGGDIRRVDGRTAFQAWNAGDRTGADVVQRYVRYLGIGVGNLINILQPERICIGGGLSGEGENLLRPLRQMVESESFQVSPTAKHPEIVKATLGNDAGIIGAASLRS